jgi:sugar phosphate isomerase/epimerase
MKILAQLHLSWVLPVNYLNCIGHVKKNVHHIEIGEFPDLNSFHYFLEILGDKDISFGLHSPLYRNQSKYDLLEKVHNEPEYAWRQFESEVKNMSSLGAEYILVHFPYFKENSNNNVNLVIETGLKKLKSLQEKYDIPIVCEPKLGLSRSPIGINSLNDLPLEIWGKYDLKLCIDIGDYLLASGEHTLEYIGKYKKYVKVVHLHNVEFINDKYIWVPVHPSHEEDEMHFKLRDLIVFLSNCKDVFFVFEHTPHTNPPEWFVEEGIQWVKDLIEHKRN